MEELIDCYIPTGYTYINYLIAVPNSNFTQHIAIVVNKLPQILGARTAGDTLIYGHRQSLIFAVAQHKFSML